MNNDKFLLEIKLKGCVDPEVTRLVEVPQNITLIMLSVVIQETMGWEGYHLHMFKFGDDYYGDVSDYDDGQTIDQRRKHLNKVLGRRRQFTYIYDFGDHWEHQITVKKSAGPSPYPFFVIEATGACPPEDCGGVFGYEAMKLAISDPDDPEHEEVLEWYGDDFDPDKVDTGEIQQRLNAL